MATGIEPIALPGYTKEYLLKLVNDALILYNGDKVQVEKHLMYMADKDPQLMKDLAWHGYFVAKAMSEKPSKLN